MGTKWTLLCVSVCVRVGDVHCGDEEEEEIRGGECGESSLWLLCSLLSSFSPGVSFHSPQKVRTSRDVPVVYVYHFTLQSWRCLDSIY